MVGKFCLDSVGCKLEVSAERPLLQVALEVSAERQLIVAYQSFAVPRRGNLNLHDAMWLLTRELGIENHCC